MKSRKEGKQHRLKLVVRNAQFVFVFFLIYIEGLYHAYLLSVGFANYGVLSLYSLD